MENKFYYKCDRELMNKVAEITMVDYEMWKEFIPIDSLEIALKDLLCEYNKKIEELEDLKQEMEDNYEPRKIDPYDEFGVSERDFS